MATYLSAALSGQLPYGRVKVQARESGRVKVQARESGRLNMWQQRAECQPQRDL